MRRFLPHYLKSAPSRLHLELAEDLAALHLRRGSRLNRRAPRGAGKSSWSTKGYALYCACEGVERYILILSESAEQAKQLLADVRAELEDNPHLAAAYPAAVGRGPVWQAGKLKLRNGVMVHARGVGGKIRGAANRSDRPSLVVVDDPNGDEDAYSATHRKRKLTWFTRAVLNMGDPDTNVIVLGTPIHREAIVCQLSDGELSAGWETKAYKGVERWPDRMDLWDHWLQLRTNLGDPDRAATSDAYFAANRDEMLRGAEVLWPDWEPFDQLMRHRAAVGPAAFNCEKNDQVGSEGAAEWPPEYFDRPGFWFWEWPQLSHKVYALDPSKGVGDKPGDYQGHVWGGVGPDGAIHVDAKLAREDAAAMLATGLEVCRSFQPDRWPIEDNGTMGFLAAELRRQLADLAAAGRPVLAPAEIYTSVDPKAARIRRAAVYLAAGRLRVRNTPGGRLLAQQLREWPTGDHDDGPDALGTLIGRLEMLVNQGR